MQEIELEIKQKPGTEDVPLPRYMSDMASGMDLHAAVESPTELKPGDIRLIPTGLCIAVPPGYEAQVRPRSGLALKHGLTVVNSPGTIDSDYRGEVCVILGNVGRQSYVIERGARIAQLVLQPVVRAKLIVKEQLSETRRADGGFGHTGS